MSRYDAATLRQLRALAMIRKHGSMAAAAEVIGLTAPAIHGQIRSLEDVFGVSVISRNGAGSELTAEGLVLADAILRIDLILEQSAAQIEALKAGKSGTVRLGVVSTAKYFVPRLMRTLRDRLPEIEVALKVGNRDAIVRDIETGGIDLAIMGRPPRTPRVDAVPLGAHPHGLVAAPDHRLSGRDSVTIADLADELFISREEGSGTRILMTRYLDGLAEGHVFRFIEMGSNETIKLSVMAGLGISFISLHTVTDEIRRGELTTLKAPGLPIFRQWFLVRPIEQPSSRAIETVAKLISDLNGSFLPEMP